MVASPAAESRHTSELLVMVRRYVLLAFLFFAVSFQGRLNAENWGGWRGPRGDGTSLENNVPLRWNGLSGENITWKIAVPGIGHSSPIVWQERIFLATCDTKTGDRLLMCLDRQTGKTRWTKSVTNSRLETKHRLNSHASSTPVTDGKIVVVSFLEIDGSTVPATNVGRARPVTPGSMVVAAYDLDGHQKWLVKPGGFVSVHGYCSCPVLFENLVIVNGDHDGDSYIVALDRTTGKTVWKVERDHKTRSYATPIIREVAGRTQMVVSGSKSICSYNPRNGSRYWKVNGPTEQFVASMVFDGELFYMAAGFPTHHVLAVRPEGNGDVTDTHVVWHETNKVGCYVPSPVLVGDYLLVADDNGTANCFEAKTGKRQWRARLGKHYSASLVTAGGLAYFLADDGVTKIVRPGAEENVIAENALGEYCYASPAISDGQIFIRGEKHLFCIGSRKKGSE
jgi:outer membrane protein assembly factor BamB